MRTLLSLESGEVRVQTPYPDETQSPAGAFWVIRGKSHVVKVLPTFEVARDYAHGFVNYLRRHEDADLEI